jgi:hypothetical protein
MTDEQQPTAEFFGDWNPQTVAVQQAAVDEQVWIRLQQREEAERFDPAEEARNLSLRLKMLRTADQFARVQPFVEEQERLRSQAISHIHNALKQVARKGSLNETVDELLGMSAAISQALNANAFLSPMEAKQARLVLSWINTTSRLPNH